MKPKSATTIRRHKKELRALIDDRLSGPIEKRIAYAMETVLTWAFEDVQGWGKMVDTARANAKQLREELGRR